MKLRVLGTQSSYNTIGHNCPGFLITDDETNLNIGNIGISFCKTYHPVETYAVKLSKEDILKHLYYF